MKRTDDMKNSYDFHKRLENTLTENERKKLLEEFQNVKKIHKNYMNSFEIITPKISQEMVKRYEIFSLENELQKFTWIKIPKTQFFFDDMIVNYEREMGDNLCLKKELFQCCFYCCTRLLNQGFVPSNKWSITGFISVDYEFMISFAWMHPYLRSKGIFRKFLIEYGQNFGPLMFEAPLSQKLQSVLHSVIPEIQSNPGMLKKYINNLRNWLRIRYKKDPSNLSDDDIMYAISAINVFQCLKANIDPESELKLVMSMIHIQKYCSGDKNKIQELFPDMDLSEFENGNFSENLIKKMIKIRSLGRNADRLCE